MNTFEHNIIAVHGNPAFELAAYLYNPFPELLQNKNLQQIIQARIQLCSETLGFCPQRIQDWLYIKTVECWAWSLQDRLDPEYWIRFLQVIEP